MIGLTVKLPNSRFDRKIEHEIQLCVVALRCVVADFLALVGARFASLLACLIVCSLKPPYLDKFALMF